MQTFLPLPDFQDSAACLDNLRLGKQIIEAGQIVRALLDPTYGWQNHPATRMWSGHWQSLLGYTEACAAEWHQRRHKDHAALHNLVGWLRDRGHRIPDGGPVPYWFGDDMFHATHRSNLLRKHPDHYRAFGWTEPPDLPYFWPEQNRTTA